MRHALIILLFVVVLPAHAHHTREHVLGAPTPPPIVTPVVTNDTGGSRLLWALGPFFLLVAVGALRWGYRHHRANKNKDTPD